MTMFTKFMLAFLLTAAIPALAQEGAPELEAGDGQTVADQPATAEDSQGGKVALQKLATTIEEALGRLSEHETAASEALAAARRAYEDRMSRASSASRFQVLTHQKFLLWSSLKLSLSETN